MTQDSRNLLANAGFNGTLDPWIRDAGTGSFSYTPGSDVDVYGTSADAKACLSSGSAYLQTPWDGSADAQRIWQCVPGSPSSTYNFGVHIQGGSYAYCDLDLYDGPGCTGTATNAASTLWLNVYWSPDERFQISTAANTASARVSCHNEGGGVAHFDLPYLTAWPGEF